MESHCCKVCGRSFPSGRSLGGHVRSHLLLSSLNSIEKPMRRHRNPRNSWQLNDVCTMWNSFFRGMVRDDLNEDDSGSYEEICSQSDREVVAFSESARPPRFENEQEYGAWCLLLLSRGSGDQKFKKQKVSAFSNESFNEFSGKYECRTCNKSFHSYQALGGHCRSHMMTRGDSSSESPATKDAIIRNRSSPAVRRSPEHSKSHQCSICGKFFASGQALGGHKRSHLVSNAAAAGGEGNALIDLNLPATDDGSILCWV